MQDIPCRWRAKELVGSMSYVNTGDKFKMEAQGIKLTEAKLGSFTSC